MTYAKHFWTHARESLIAIGLATSLVIVMLHVFGKTEFTSWLSQVIAVSPIMFAVDAVFAFIGWRNE